jgi:hypothetical protein
MVICWCHDPGGSRREEFSGRGASRRRNWLAATLGAVGLGLLVFLVLQIGPAAIAGHLKGLVAILPAVLFLTGFKYPLQAAGWRLALPPDRRPPWAESIGATITGDALGYLTWAGPLTGEPIRALLIRRTVPLPEGIAAGAAERAIYNITAALLVCGVLAVLLGRAYPVTILVVLAGSIAAASVFVVVARRSRQRAGGTIDGATSDGSSRSGDPTLHGRPAFFAAVRAIWRGRRSALPIIALLCLAQHAVLVGEAYLMLGTLGAVTLQTALIFEAVTKIVNSAGLLVPGRWGIAEGGSALLADALGFAASHGLSLALMRRVRALIWAGVGLVLLPFQEARARART